MFLSIDMQSEVPIYQQLRNQLIEGIATSKLKEGDSLPSVRQMASDLGINLHTVNKVYTLLRQEGFLIVHRKIGVVVNQKAGFLANDSFYNKLEEELRPTIAEAFCRGVSKEEFLLQCSKVFEFFEKENGGGKL